MSKFYKIVQGTHFEGHWVEPQFPLTIENMELNIKHGLAFEIEEPTAYPLPPWGSGIFRVEEEKNTYTCLTSNFDSSD